MDNNFTNQNFEKFLKENADGLKMFPSAHIWKNVSREMTKRRRRFGFSLTALIVSVSLLAYHIIDSAKVMIPVKVSTSAQVGTTTNAKNITFNSTSTAATEIENNNNTATVTTAKTNTASDYRESNNQLSLESRTPVISIKKALVNQPKDDQIASLNPAEFSQVESINAPQNFAPVATTERNNIVPSENILTTKSIASPNTENISSNTENILDEEIAVEKIANSKKQKLSFQFHFTPTVSYRKLSENKSYLRSASQSNIPVNQAPLYNVNNAVTHKPDVGFEVGFSAKYSINRKIKLRGGVQFNVNRYEIKAFNNTNEVATIALNTANGLEPVNTISSYRNYGSSSQINWLQNYSFQFSAPIGAEFRLKKFKNLELGIGTSVQPTYVLGDRAYLISSDYKNYAEVPWLTRRWNVNTSLETYIAYSTGRLNWQVGPQIRYQLLSSFIHEYPVKENLFDYGLKVGISFNRQ